MARHRHTTHAAPQPSTDSRRTTQPEGTHDRAVDSILGWDGYAEEIATTPPPEHEAVLAKIKEVRAQAIEHAVQARRLSAKRRDQMQSLLDDDGLLQADVARELGCHPRPSRR